MGPLLWIRIALYPFLIPQFLIPQRSPAADPRPSASTSPDSLGGSWYAPFRSRAALGLPNPIMPWPTTNPGIPGAPTGLYQSFSIENFSQEPSSALGTRLSAQTLPPRVLPANAPPADALSNPPPDSLASEQLSPLELTPTPITLNVQPEIYRREDAFPESSSSDPWQPNSAQNSAFPSYFPNRSMGSEPLLANSIQPAPWILPGAGVAAPWDWSRGQEAITGESLPRSPFQLLWGLRTSAVSDSNPLLSQRPASRALRVELGPQIRLQLGQPDSHFQAGANYAGAYTRNLETPHLPFFEHRSALDTRWLTPKLQLGLRGALTLQQTGSRDTGARSTERTVSARFQVNFQATEKLSNELSLDTIRSRFPPFSGSEEARLRMFFDYSLGPKLRLGLGAGGGGLRPQNGEQQKYLQGLARASYQPTAKLAWNASFGLERRHFEGGPDSGVNPAADPALNPVFSLNGLWSATARASFTLEAERRSQASATLNDTNFQSTKLKLGWNEQLTTSLQTRISAGYERADYQSTLPARTQGRQDDYWLGRAEIQWVPRRHSTLGVFVESSANHSSEARSYSFRRTQLGLTWNLQF